MNHHGRGNRKAQQKRKRERMKHHPKKQPEKVLLIDGNYSYYPVAYCKIHGAYLTEGLANTHRCVKRHCNGYDGVGDVE